MKLFVMLLLATLAISCRTEPPPGWTIVSADGYYGAIDTDGRIVVANSPLLMRSRWSAVRRAWEQEKYESTQNSR